DPGDGREAAGQVRAQQRVVDAHLGGEVDVDDLAPQLLVEVGEHLVPGDAGVVDDGPDPGPGAVDGDDVLGDALARVVGGDVELQCGAADLVGDPGQLLAGLGDVDGDDARPVP